MPTDISVNSLVINKLTKAQYEGIQNPSETELYLVPDEKFAIVNYTSGTTIEVGKCYIINTTSTAVSITLPSVSTGYLENIIIYATIGTNALNISAPSGGSLLYAESCPEFESGNLYEINCLWNGSAWVIAGNLIETRT